MKMPARILQAIDDAGGSIECHLLLPDAGTKCRRVRVSELIRDGYIVRLYKITEAGLAKLRGPDKREAKARIPWTPDRRQDSPGLGERYPLVELQDIDLLKADAMAARHLFTPTQPKRKNGTTD